MFKKVTAVAVAGLMLGVLVGCGSTSLPPSSSSSSSASSSAAPTNVTLKVWGPELQQTLLNTMSASFAALHPEWNITWDIGICSEGTAKTQLLGDVDAGADVFAFADDQLAELAAAGALSKVQQYKTDVTARNSAAAIDTATLGTDLYAYPETADNGYFLYYDSSKLNASQVASMDSLLTVAEGLDKKVNFPSAGGWIASSFFLNSASHISFNPTTSKVTCDWNTTGLAAAEGAMATLSRSGVSNAEQNDAATMFTAGSIIAAVTGTWNAAGIKTALGENYAAVKLPTYTNGLNQQVQLGSFVGSKLIGVKSTSAYLAAAHAFANYITNEENQLLRFTETGVGPSNIAAAANSAVTADVALAALGTQSAYGYAQSKSVGGKFWNSIGAYFDMCYAGSWGSYPDAQAALDALVGAITA